MGQTRGIIAANKYLPNGDPKRAVERFYRVSTLEKPPIRLPLHKNVLDAMWEKAKHFQDIVDEYSSWSEGIYLEE